MTIKNNLSHLKSNYRVLFLLLISVLSVALYLWVVKQSFFIVFVDHMQEFVLIYIIFLLLLKILAIVWPPIPGSLLTLGSIPVIGVWNALLVETIGGSTGHFISFLIAHKYGISIVQKFAGTSKLQRSSIS